MTATARWPLARLISRLQPRTYLLVVDVERSCAAAAVA